MFSSLVRPVALAFSVLAGSLFAAPVNFQSGSVSLTQTNATTWTTVNFTRTFTAAPVVVIGPATKANGDPLVMRVRNVTATSFQYQVDEWDYLTGDHAAETVHYFALSEGTHVLGTQRWQVGRVAAVNRTASTVTLTGFATAPVVLAQVESTVNSIVANNPRALKTRLASVTAGSFQVNLETQESYATAISNESIGYIAVSAGTGYLDGKVLSAVTTSALTTEAFSTLTFPAARTNPIFIGQAQTKNDANPGELRMQSLTATSVQVQFQEEISANADVTHTAEAVGYIVLGDMNGELTAKVEVGDLNVTQANTTLWTKVNLGSAYTTPVVVMGPLSYTNSTAVTVRVRNVLATDTANANKASFEFQIDRWDHNTAAHNFLEHISYIVMESGTHAVGGVVWQAGRKTGVTQTEGAQALSPLFPNAPAVFSQVATTVEAAAVQSRVSDVTATSFNLELDESEIDATPHAAETVHWIAMTQGVSHFFGNQMRFNAGSMTGMDSAFRTRSFGRLHADPYLFAAMQTNVDADPATLRWRYLFADKVDIVAQEDGHPAQFGEGTVSNSHSAETVAYLVVQGAADADEDGAPDGWESSVGLSATNGADGGADTDGDTLTNQQEYHNRLDFATSTSHIIFNGGTITVGNAVTNAYEINDKSATSLTSGNARFRITRTGALAPLTVNFSLAGTPTTDTTRSPAGAADYTLWTADTGGTQLTNSINLAVNAQSVDVYVRPVVDNID
ncbi:MAG: hypothetical protein NTV80_19240, partial [Verrucomicrobia bacterium]|nr:hypothetical protein [Verrucomicrobiota bacterium]